jgi:hypothetical protein
MTCNIGKTDRIVRFVVGAAIIVAGLLAGSWLALIGLIPIVTAAVRFCPLYPVLHFTTNKEPPPAH